MRKQKEVNIYSLIHKLKNHGYAFLSSVPQYQVAASLVAVTGLIIMTINGNITFLRNLLPITGTNDSSQKSGFIPGLSNLGNNCFLNVILQALASCASFEKYIQGIVEEDVFSAEEMPLIDALDSLLRDLCTLHNERRVSSPRKVMREMEDYIPSFNLTSQQDAAEALLHLLSSLKNELLECYVPHYDSLADIYALPLSRIAPQHNGRQNARRRWQQYLLGPFDGILCSSLACRSCSSQLSMGLEFFDSLSLSVLLDDSQTIVEGSSIESCLKKFTTAELVEFRCNQCWHDRAIKYYSAGGGNETNIEMLKCCVKKDSCDCRNLLSEKAILWSNYSSCTIKQFRIARCPKILCMDLKRASVNAFGESVKLQGHISFPMVLDLFPYMKDAMGEGIEKLKENFRVMRVKQRQQPDPWLGHQKQQHEKQMLKSIYGTAADNVISETTVKDDLGVSTHNSSRDILIQSFEDECCFPHHEYPDHPESTRAPLQSDSQISDTCQHSKRCIYRLVSVVEHFGRGGSEHYTVYRRAKHEPEGRDSDTQFEPAQWFCASDTKVFSVSEREVLAADASLLFYERIEVPPQVSIDSNPGSSEISES